MFELNIIQYPEITWYAKKNPFNQHLNIDYLVLNIEC